jgi:holo-[acyl-carrier protein] synthase
VPASPQPFSDPDTGRPPDRPVSPPLRVRVGVDLAEVARVEKLMASQPGLRERVFTPRELAYCYRRRRSAEHLAGRWAAKEAVLKSLGTGLGPRMEWTDVEVVNDLNGRPRARLHGEVEAVARSLGMHHIDISLSHTGGLVVAYAILMYLPPDSADAAPSPTRRITQGDDQHEA